MGLTERGKLINCLPLKRLNVLEGEGLFEKGRLNRGFRVRYDKDMQEERREQLFAPLPFMRLPRRLHLRTACSSCTKLKRLW